MSVRKRTWKTAKGETKDAWIVDYVDQHGKRHIKTFQQKKQADTYHATVAVEVRHGTHTADGESITIEEAGGLWVKAGEANDLERATLDEYRRHLDMHIKPYIGNVKLSKLTAPMVSEFRTKLREGTPAPGQETGTKRSPAMVKKVIGSLSSILAGAHEVDYVAQNVVRSLTTRKKKRTKARQRRKLKVGVDIPTPDEIKAIVGKLDGRWRPLLLVAICGASTRLRWPWLACCGAPESPSRSSTSRATSGNTSSNTGPPAKPRRPNAAWPWSALRGSGTRARRLPRRDRLPPFWQPWPVPAAPNNLHCGRLLRWRDGGMPSTSNRRHSKSD